MSDVIDDHGIALPSTEAYVRSTAPGIMIAAGIAAATISVGAPAVAPTFLTSASSVREGATSVRIFKTVSPHSAAVRAASKPAATERDFDAERRILEDLRDHDRRGLVWRGIKGALGLGPRVQATTPDDRVNMAVDRILSVRSRGVH